MIITRSHCKVLIVIVIISEKRQRAVQMNPHFMFQHCQLVAYQENNKNILVTEAHEIIKGYFFNIKLCLP